MKSISCIIVTYNSGKHISSSLKSVLSSKGILLSEVIVIDNASTDETESIVKKFAKKYRKVKLIRLKKNLGFPYATNLAMRHVNSDYIVLVNPDVIVDEHCFSKLYEFLEQNPSVAVVQPKILHSGNHIDSAGGLMDILGHGYHIGKFEKDNRQYDKSRDILYASFACAMIRSDIYYKLGGMDSMFFLYNEDLDFCWRCWHSGYRVVYVPNAVAYHFGQHSTKKMPYQTIYFTRRNRLFSVFGNYSLFFGILFSGILLFLYVGLAFYTGVKKDKFETRIMVKLLATIPKYLRYLIRKRMLTSKYKKIGNFKLIRKGLIEIRLIGIKLFVYNTYRKMLNI